MSGNSRLAPSINVSGSLKQCLATGKPASHHHRGHAGV